MKKKNCALQAHLTGKDQNKAVQTLEEALEIAETKLIPDNVHLCMIIYCSYVVQVDVLKWWAQC